MDSITWLTLLIRSGLRLLHDGCRVWKGRDWDAMNWLREQGMIYFPVGKAKFVVLTEEARGNASLLSQKQLAFEIGRAEGILRQDEQNLQDDFPSSQRFTFARNH